MNFLGNQVGTIGSYRGDANGNQVWVARYDNGGGDSGRDIAVDASGNVYVTGWSEDSSGIRDYATVKYAP